MSCSERRRPGRIAGIRPRRCALFAHRVHDAGECGAEGGNVGAGLHRFRCQMPTERACAGDAAEQAEDVPRDRVQSHAAFERALDIGSERFGRRLRRREARGLAEQHRIDGQQPPRLLIGGAPHHHAVDAGEMRERLVEIRDAAVEHDLESGMGGLEPIDAGVIERRDVAVLARREPSSQALRACTMSAATPAASTAPVNASSASSGSWSSMPMRHLTVTGSFTVPVMAATHSPTRAGSAIRQAPKRPSCTRSEGQPTLRLTSS